MGKITSALTHIRSHADMDTRLYICMKLRTFGEGEREKYVDYCQVQDIDTFVTEDIQTFQKHGDRLLD